MFKDPSHTEGKPSGLISECYVTEIELTEEDEFFILASDGLWVTHFES